MRTLIISLLLCSIVHAEPFLKANCADHTNYLIINNYITPCPLSLDVEYIPIGVNDFTVIPMGQSVGDDISFQISKRENRKAYTYKIIYDRMDKVYFNKRESSIRVKK